MCSNCSGVVTFDVFSKKKFRFQIFLAWCVDGPEKITHAHALICNAVQIMIIKNKDKWACSSAPACSQPITIKYSFSCLFY